MASEFKVDMILISRKGKRIEILLYIHWINTKILVLIQLKWAVDDLGRSIYQSYIDSALKLVIQHILLLP